VGEVVAVGQVGVVLRGGGAVVVVGLLVVGCDLVVLICVMRLMGAHVFVLLLSPV